jgi:hypothetical protein
LSCRKQIIKVSQMNLRELYSRKASWIEMGTPVWRSMRRNGSVQESFNKYELQLCSVLVGKQYVQHYF